MCGIFGAVVSTGSPFTHERDKLREVRNLFELSASRGKEAAGFAIANQDALVLFKEPCSAAELVRMDAFRRMLADDLTLPPAADAAVAFIGHSRLVTDGGREAHGNNQPVVTQAFVGVHNGIIVNHEALWRAHPELQRTADVDSEVIFALLGQHLGRGASTPRAVADTFAALDGAASIAALSVDHDQLILATNNGSLYYLAGAQTLVFASEAYILEKFREDGALKADLAGATCTPVRAGEGVVVDLRTRDVLPFTFAAPPEVAPPARRATPRTIIDRSAKIRPPARAVFRTPDLARLEARFPYTSTTYRLRRCSRCVLPDSMPFIEFDAAGVCSYCRKHLALKHRGHDALEQLVAPYRRAGGKPDCVVGISGGRDSMYGLHYVKTVLKMNPVAFTYDWGMVTDLARRNVSRICGKLGIEHILVSADIDEKRRFIRKNVEAWLKQPALGAVPLFMAGDKAYFHHLNKVREQLGTPLGILCENLLERTDFKTGFAGVRPEIVDDVRAYTIKQQAKAKLAAYYAGQFLRNPSYLNESLLDTALAFVYFYVIKRNYTNLYGYVRWDEDVVNRTLIDEYGFELAPDTESTWRIGDGTAAFYNYIYHTVAGFSEHDTLRSNQIREGVLTRDEALARIDRENQPRFPSIQWYLDVLRIERPIEDVLETINRIPKLYTPIATPQPAERPPARSAAR